MPTRTCVGCQQTGEQSQLVRLVVDGNGRLRVDRKRARPGRGAYLHPIQACVDEAVKTSGFAKSFRRRTQPVDGGRLWVLLTEDGEEREHE